MGLKELENLEVTATFDAHVHLRDGSMMETVVPTIRSGGVNMVYVMVGLCLIALSGIVLTMNSQISFHPSQV